MTRAPNNGTVHALIALDGHILSADEPLMRLQIAAGGQPDGRLLVPQLAAVARLARKLGILVSRPVIAGGDGCDVSMWVRAQPREDAVSLVMMDWREVPMRITSPAIGAARAADIASVEDGWAWRTDAAMLFTSVDPAREQAGYVRPGMPFAALFDLSDAQDGAAVLGRIAERRAFFGKLVRDLGRPPSSGPGWFRVSGHALFDAEGHFVGYRGRALALDAAELVTAHAEPEGTQQDDPAQLLATIPDFGKRLDAALRRPLGRIIANADTISEQREGPLRQDYAGYASDIADAGRHLMELVDDLADLQAIDRPQFHVAREPIDLADIARRTAGLLAVKAADRRIRLEPPRADESAPAIGEFRRALQILVNLVGNAIRYGPEESQVWIRVETDDSCARLVVADQGRGIAPEDHERVFAKFERLGRDDLGGSGLGLYISRRLARAMGGDISIDSAPGQGARFVLTLPVE